MADIKLTIDDSNIIQVLEDIEKKLAETGKAADDMGKEVKDSMGEISDASKKAGDATAKYAKQAEELKGQIHEQAVETEKMNAVRDAEAKKIAESTRQTAIAKVGIEAYRKEQLALLSAYEKEAQALTKRKVALEKLISTQDKVQAYQVKELELIQKSLGLLEGKTAAVNANVASLGAQEGAVKKATVAQRLFNFILSINPIGLIIAAVGLLVNQLRKYQGVMDFASKITAQIGAVFTEVTNRAISLGKAVYSLVTLDFAGFGKNAAEGISGFGDAMVNAWDKAGNLADATVSLRDAQLAAAISTAKLTVASEKYQAAADNESKSFNDRISALKNAIAVESEIAKIKVGFAAQDAANAKAAFELSNKNVAEKEALLEKELAFVDAKNEADKTRIGLIVKLNKLEEDRLAFIKKNIEDAQALVDKLDVSLEEDPTAKKVEQINQGVEKQIEAITAGIEKIKEVEKLRPLNEDELALRQNLQDKIVQVIDQGEKQKIDALLDGLQAEMAAQDKIDKAKEDAAKKAGDDARAALKDILELENTRIDITEAQFDNYLATLRAGGAKEDEVKKVQFEFDRRIKAQRIEAEIAYQQKLLELVGNGEGAELIQAEIDKLETVLEGLEIPGAKDKGDDKPRSIYELMGINFDDPEQQQAFQEAVDLIMDSLGQIAEARVREAEAATEAAQTKVDAAEEALEKEQELAKEGLASDIENKKKALDEATKLRNAALKAEEKAKKQQIALESISQVSSLITAAASTLAQFTGPQLPIGIILVAAMFTAFALAKAKALKAAEAPKLRKGMRFDGPTHEAGNEDMVSDGRRTYAVEKDEWLIGTAPSREHNAFLAKLNKGDYKGVDLLKAVWHGKGDHDKNPLSESSPRIRRMEERLSEAKEQNHFQALAKAYEKSAENISREIREKPVVAPWKQGYKIIKQTESGTDTKTVQPE